MSNLNQMKPVDLAALALFQATGKPIFDAESAIVAERRVSNLDKELIACGAITLVAAAPKGPPASCYELVVDGVPIKFTGTYYPASKGMRERGTGIPQEPDEPATFEVDEIWIGDVEVSALLNQWADGVVNKLEAHGRGANNDD